MTTLSLRLDRTAVERLLRGGVSVTAPAAIFRIHGPGAIDCLQGVLTNDLAAPGPGHLVYAAMLTPKGMIVVDFWVMTGVDEVVLIGPAEGRSAAAETFLRSFPPRLAAVEDLSDAWRVMWLYGDMAEPAMAEAHLVPPLGGPGQVASFGVLGAEGMVARATDTAPFVSLVTGPSETIERYGNLLTEHGVAIGTPDEYHAARIMAGWPALGIEIGEKTLPQEVRFEAIEGVSFTKGCFIGQETVARVHFRGQTQKELRGLDWIDLGPLDGTDIANKDRALGQVHSVLVLPDRRIGLGMVRREADIGDTVIAAGREATIAPLPFDHPDHAA